MKIQIPLIVRNPLQTVSGGFLTIRGDYAGSQDSDLVLQNTIAYPGLINSHDHLVGNWYPRAGKGDPYQNTHVWVEDMKGTPSYLERNKIWVNDGSFHLTEGNATLLVELGVYKNLFSGVVAVQDHGPNQPDAYYEDRPINIIKDYRQLHSITLGNWWGGGSATDEMNETRGELPFIVHLGEGTDEITRQEFGLLRSMGLLRRNTVIVHGIALREPEIREIAQVGASVCWCPASNEYLLGETLQLETCLRYGVNVAIGTDSAMSGSINLLEELRVAHRRFRHVPGKLLFAMVTSHAVRALNLPDSYGKLTEDSPHFVLINRKTLDPFDNLLQAEMSDIRLVFHNNRPVYGDADLLSHFTDDVSGYTFFNCHQTEKFVLGDPQGLNTKVDSILGYHKDLPYLPF